MVIAGYPATPLISAKARLCVSAAYNLEDRDRMLRACNGVGDLLMLKFGSGIAGGTEVVGDSLDEEREGETVPPRWGLEEVLKCGVRDTRIQLVPGKVTQVEKK